MAAKTGAEAHAADKKPDVDAPPCYFLKMAPELRNQIYELILLEPNGVFVRDKCRPPPPLIRTCRKIRAEAGPLYYAANTFYVRDSQEICLPWLEFVAADMRKHLRTLRLYTPICWAHSNEADRSHALLQRLQKGIVMLGMPAQIKLEVGIVVGSGKVWTCDPKGLWQRRRLQDEKPWIMCLECGALA